jgi:hypothetical protein
MRILLFCTVLIVSCGNPKGQIVDELRATKDSIDLYDSKISHEQWDLPQRISDSMKKVHPIWNEREIQHEIDRQALESEIDGEIDYLHRQKSLYQRKYDSLEFELKKY